VPPDPSAPTLRAITLSGAGFLAVGDSGRIQTSPDGKTWITAGSGTTANLHSVQCGSSTNIGIAISQCFAVGDSGIVETSNDNGISWSSQTLAGGATNLRAVQYGNFDNNVTAPGVVGIGGASPTAINTWVAVGDAGTIFVNNSGVWVAAPLTSAPNLVALSYITQFVALDASGNVFISQTAADGSWSLGKPTGLISPAAIATSQHGYVAIGSGGDNVSSF
jgi:hypothetical protein